MQDVLTIVTVSFRSERLILENIRLAERLNPEISQIQWIVVNNEGRPLEMLAAFQSERSCIRILPGSPAFFTPWDEGSYHHSLGLTLALPYVTTQYLLVLDPDFYICRPNWISFVLGTMDQKGLSFFGATWSPAIPSKYQNFPCVHCLFVDLERVPAAALDFTPDLPISARRRKFADGLNRWKLSIPKWMRRRLWFSELLQFLILRQQARDTGYRIFESFHRTKSSYECLKFLTREDQILALDRFLLYFPAPVRWWLKKRKLVADPAQVLEQQKQITFLKAIVGKFYYRLHWDEFLFEGAPFGFHLRRVARANSEADPVPYGSEDAELNLLGRIFGKTGQLSTAGAGHVQ